MAAPGFIHTYTLSRASAASVTDSEGIPVVDTTETAVASARVCMLSAKEQEAFGRVGMDVDASLLTPLGTDVQRGDIAVVTADDVGAGDAELVGTYVVAAVRHAVIHLRVLAKRRNE